MSPARVFRSTGARTSALVGVGSSPSTNRLRGDSRAAALVGIAAGLVAGVDRLRWMRGGALADPVPFGTAAPALARRVGG